jgi:hypothetical protein
VGEQPWLSPRNASDPVRCLPPMASQGLELPMRPSSQNTVDVSQGRVERRFVVPAVVVDPAPDVAVEHPGQVVQRLVAALVKRPASDRLSDRLESFVACRGAEQDAECTPPASRQPRPERVAEKVERLVWVASTPIFILAIDDFRLLRMKRQSAVSEPPLKRCAQLLACASLRQWHIASSA